MRLPRLLPLLALACALTAAEKSPLVLDGTNRASNLTATDVIRLPSAGPFYTGIYPSATADRDITLPDATTTLVGTNVAQTLTNKTLTSPVINTATIAGGTINNASVGATTPSTGAFTTLGASGITAVTNATASTLSTNGALTVAGGVGIVGALNIGGNFTATGSFFNAGGGTFSRTLNGVHNLSISNVSSGSSAYSQLIISGDSTATAYVGVTSSTTSGFGGGTNTAYFGSNGSMFLLAGSALKATLVHDCLHLS